MVVKLAFITKIHYTVILLFMMCDSDGNDYKFDVEILDCKYCIPVVLCAVGNLPLCVFVDFWVADAVASVEPTNKIQHKIQSQA